jgi:hypothetical protein
MVIFHSYVKLPEGKFPEKLDKPHSGPVSAVPNQVGPQGISLPGSSQNYRRWTTWQSPGFFFGCCFGVKFVKCYKTHLKETSWKKKNCIAHLPKPQVSSHPKRTAGSPIAQFGTQETFWKRSNAPCLAWQQRIHGNKKHVQITTANVDVIVPKCFCV